MTRYLCLIVVVWLLATGGPGVEPEKKEDAVAKEFAGIQGKWRCVEEHSNGTVIKSRDGQGHVIGFEKEIENAYDADGQVGGRESIKLNPSKSPKEIDTTCLFLLDYPEEKGKTYCGIYRLEGDELKIAIACAPWNRERPKEFTTQVGSHFTVFTYKRIKR